MLGVGVSAPLLHSMFGNLDDPKMKNNAKYPRTKASPVAVVLGRGLLRQHAWQRARQLVLQHAWQHVRQHVRSRAEAACEAACTATCVATCVATCAAPRGGSMRDTATCFATCGGVRNSMRGSVHSNLSIERLDPPMSIERVAGPPMSIERVA
jgi:hypothetical protein